MSKRDSDATPPPRRAPRGRTPSPLSVDPRGERIVLDENLRGLIDQMPVGVLIVEAPGGRVLLANQRFLQICGPAGAVPLNADELSWQGWHADGRPYGARDWPVMRSLLAGERVIGERIDIRRGDGTTGHIRVSSAPLRDSRGRTLGAISVQADITEESRAEQALRANEQHFRTLADNCPDVIVRFDRQGRHIYVNNAIERVTGVPREQFIGKTNREVGLPSRLALRWEEELARVIESGERWTSDFEYPGPQGSLTFEHVMVPEIGPDGEVQGVLCVGRDVTERRRVDDQHRALSEQVAQQKRQLDTVVAAMADGLVVFGPEAEILRTNATAERLLGLTEAQRHLPASERAQLLCERAADGSDFPPGAAPLQRALSGETVNGEVVILEGPPPHERRWVSLSEVPIRGQDGNVAMVVASLTDVTRLHDLQEERDDLLRMISHDLRTPLSALLLQAQMLQRSLEPGDRNLKRLDTIITNAQRLATMIRDLVDMVRLENGRVQLIRRDVDLESFTATLIQRLAGTLQTERVRLDFEPGLPPLTADPDRLERILVNLVSNALKYSRPPEEVIVRARREEQAVCIDVVDHGIGISQNELPHMFERFFRTQNTRQQEGLGLGLYITAMLARAHGGSIEVESQLGQGSVFRVRLPLA